MRHRPLDDRPFATKGDIPLAFFDRTTLSPIVNISIILIALAASWLLVPIDVEPEGALKISASVLASGLTLGMFLMVWQRPASIFNPVAVLAASPVYWLLLDPIQGAYPLMDVSPAQVRKTYLCISLFAIAVWLAACHRAWRLPHSLRAAALLTLSPGGLFFVANLAFVLAFLRFAIPSGFDLVAMTKPFTADRWSAPWTRGALGGWDSILDHFAYFGYILPALAVLQLRASGWLSGKTLLTFLYACVIGALLSTGGGRRIIGVLGGSAFVVWFLSARPPRFKHLVIFAILAGLLLWLLQTMLIYRGVGLARAFDAENKVKVETVDYLHVDDNFLRTCQMLHIIPEYHPHVGFKWLLWIAVRPIPRVLWPSKPVDPGFDLATYLGEKGVSLTCSLIGELYMAFGLLGCIIGGWCMGRLALVLRDILNLSLSTGGFMVFGSGLLALFAGMRSGIDLVLMSYGTLAWVVLVWIYREATGSASPKSSSVRTAGKPSSPGRT